MKTAWKIAGVLLLAAVAFGAAVALPQLRSHALTRQDGEHECANLRTLTLNATSTITAQPDIAIVTVGVKTQNDSAAKALSANNDQMRRIYQTLAQYGIEKKDIRTVNLNLYRREERDNKGKVVRRYYVATNTVQVTVRDLAKVGEVLGAVVQDGANSIQGIRFDLSNRDELLKQAQLAAVEQARERAKAIAEAAGAELGDVRSISFQTVAPVPRVMLSAAMPKSADSVPVSGGEMTISATVNMVFDLK